MSVQIEKWDDLRVATNKSSRGSSKYVSFFLTKAGSTSLYLSTAFMREVADNYAMFGWSKNNNAIIFIFTKHSDFPGVIKVSKKESRSATAAIQSFLNFFNIDKKEVVGSYIPKYEKLSEDRSGWVVYLNDKIKDTIT